MTASNERPLSDANARAALNERHSFRGEDFSGFELTTVRLAGKFITSCDFSRSDLRSATLDGAWISGCDFSEANLQGASLRGTHLTACQFRGTDLRGTDLRDASLQKQNTGDDSGGCDLTAAFSREPPCGISVTPLEPTGLTDSTPSSPEPCPRTRSADLAAWVHSGLLAWSVPVPLEVGHRPLRELCRPWSTTLMTFLRKRNEIGSRHRPTDLWRLCGQRCQTIHGRELGSG